MKKIGYWYPVLLWMGIIFVMSSYQAVKSSDFYWADFALKKTVHMIEYGILWLLIYRAMTKTSMLNVRQIGWLSLVITLIYAASDEFHQTFVPTREGTLRDVVIDGLGATLAFRLFWFRLRKLKKIS